MSNYSEYMRKKKILSDGKGWVNNKHKIHSQSGEEYSKVVDANTSLLQFCGQSSSGANNYHSADKEFIRYIEKSIKYYFDIIVDTAIEYAEEDVKEAGISAKEDIESMLKEINV